MDHLLLALCPPDEWSGACRPIAIDFNKLANYMEIMKNSTGKKMETGI